ncbi:NADPH-dependent FMN reductase [Flavisphingomonas formosensis]|uniref:NADPH-dependent FMN reductase n=1 Tax=Flavisphingomonas formosensis TaxID=861534 RepID=UPI0012F7AFE0|nr:NAD(P)H-dependent oxidoreductase [Sphingomonas formosensis]
MSEGKRVAVMVGSLRRDGYSSLLARALAALAPASLTLDIVSIRDLPLYDADLDDDPPEAYTLFRDAVRAADAVLFVTPEYNRSIPAPLKNAIDVGSRPYGQSVFSRKPAAVVSQSPGAMGGFGANHAVRQSLVFLNMPTLQQPEIYLAHSDALFDEDGAIAEEKTRQFLTQFLHAFEAWIARTGA